MKCRENKVSAFFFLEWAWLSLVIFFLFLLLIQWELESKATLDRAYEAQKILHKAHLEKNSHSHKMNLGEKRNRFWSADDPIYSRW